MAKPRLGEGLIAMRALRPVLAGLGSLGFDTTALAQDAGIPLDLAQDPEAAIPHRQVMSLWELAAAQAGDGEIGLQVAEAAPVESFEVYAYALPASANLRQGLLWACRYQRLVHQVSRLELEEEAGGAILRHSLPAGRELPRPPADFLAATWMSFCRRLAGAGFRPRALFLPQERPASVASYLRLFGVEPIFASGRLAMAISAADLERPNPAVDRGLFELLDRYAAGLLEAKPRSEEGLSARLRAIFRVTTTGIPTAGEAAKALGLSVRSLHRGLEAEGRGFLAQRDAFLRERAEGLLARGDYCLAEIAFLLGFSDIRSFYRAFRRWTGVTPAERKAQLALAEEGHQDGASGQ